MIDLKNKDKAEVLAKLYNASQPLGMGIFHFDSSDMTIERARELLDSGRTYFDYLKGRVMKIDPYLYDRDNGQGAAGN